MGDELAIDKREVRRSFEHAAATYDAAAVLQHEVCARMLERLQYVKHEPRAILDAGSGTGNAIPSLLARYPGAGTISGSLLIAVVAVLASQSNFSGIAEAPLYVLAGVMIIALHAGVMLLAARLFQYGALPLDSCSAI